jgi:pimeloyl-ACP methyl ester carboxylesterase
MASQKGGVVLLHGLGRTSGSMRLIGMRIEQAGFQVEFIRYPSTRHPLDTIAAILEPQVDRFAATIEGKVHFVTHSLGGLAVRALLARYRPENLGHVVMLAPPNGGSEWADALLKLRLASLILGPVSEHLATRRDATAEEVFGPIDYSLGIIAGDRPIDPIFARLLMTGAHDGKVSVAATKVEGMTDHLVMPVGHPLMPFHPKVAQQAITFLMNGAFAR